MSKKTKDTEWCKTIFKMFLEQRLRLLGYGTNVEDFKQLTKELYEDVEFKNKINEVIESYANPIVAKKYNFRLLPVDKSRNK